MTMRPKALALLASASVLFSSAASAQLLIDFNSTTQDGGPHNEPGFEPYNAGHEVAADFTTQTYSAFGTTVSVTPTWPNTTDNRVQQMIDRGAGNDANWTGANLDLVTDFLGIDTRTGNGGNGDFDGVTGTPTFMDLTLGGLPAGSYNWTSFHHDTEHVHAAFQVELDTGAGFSSVGTFQMTDSTPGGNPDSGNPVSGPDAASLSSTVNFAIDATGGDVVVRFIPLSGGAVHTQIFGINGFTVVPEPSTVALFAGLGVLALVAVRRRRIRG